MVYQTLHYEKKENIGIIHIKRPATGRDELGQLADELSDLCGEIAWDGEVRVVLLAGIGGDGFPIFTFFS
jgi:enoyl-CoA hydratase/carnithine racemase